MVAILQDRVSQRGPVPDGVRHGYRHYRKRIIPREAVRFLDVTLKWYDIAFLEFPISDQLHGEAREFISTEFDSGSFQTSGETGFVILHDCGDIVFLLISTWRGNNELWETVFVKHPDLGGTFRPQRGLGDHRPTFCVWELGAVLHESAAWTRYLSSARTASDLEIYLDEQYAGEI